MMAPFCVAVSNDSVRASEHKTRVLNFIIYTCACQNVLKCTHHFNQNRRNVSVYPFIKLRTPLFLFRTHAHTHLHKYTQTHLPTHVHTDNGAAAFLQLCLLCFVSKFNCNRNCNCNYCCTRTTRLQKHTYLQCRQLLFLHMHLSSLAVSQENTHRHTCLSGNLRHMIQSCPACLGLWFYI